MAGNHQIRFFNGNKSLKAIIKGFEKYKHQQLKKAKFLIRPALDMPSGWSVPKLGLKRKIFLTTKTDILYEKNLFNLLLATVGTGHGARKNNHRHSGV
jgi:hypothetical protein